jgi:hypothetical protein
LLAIVADGYGKPKYWDEEGMQWFNKVDFNPPIYWLLNSHGWKIKKFSQWHPLSIIAGFRTCTIR